MDEIQQYDEFAVKHKAAYAAFSSIYEDRFPPPQPTPVEADSLFVPIALVVMIIASVLVSGSRTVIEFGGGFFGLMAFLMLEGAIVAYAFYRTRRNFTEARLETVRKMANFGLSLAFVVAVAANIHSVLKEKGVPIAEGVNTIILVMVGISAPTLAFISGDIMAVESKANGVKARKSRDDDAEKLAIWQEGKSATWTREKSRWGVKVEIEIQRPPAVRPLSILSSGQTGHGQGFNRESKAASIVRSHLEQHPEDMSIPVRQLAEMLKVGKSTISNVIRDMRSGGQ